MKPGVRCLPIMLAMCALNAASVQAQTTPLSGSQLEDAVEAATSVGLARELRPTPIAHARGNAGQFAGYSVEVVVSKDQAGRWKNTKATTFIAG
ncbi:hypothetical protein [Gemmatimonas sp.]|uniref:hypothetical protein n=1 Tax=Gemmatimonas sp. TaxID=1962908 RepID=UPI0035630452